MKTAAGGLGVPAAAVSVFRPLTDARRLSQTDDVDPPGLPALGIEAVSQTAKDAFT